MLRNMARWSSCDTLDDKLSQYSEPLSNLSACDSIRSPDIGQRMHTLFKKQLHTDVKFVISCGVRPKPVLLAHKAVLAIGSRKFQKMLYGRESEVESSEIQINNISFDAFKNVLEYLYTDDVIFENDRMVLETLAAASAFEVHPLVEKCESYIESIELTDENVCTKFQTAVSNKLTLLKSKCIEFIQDNTGSVLRSADFLTVSPSTVEAICKFEKLNLRSEIELLSAIIRYIEANSNSKTNKRVEIEPYLRHLRLLNVSCEDFNQFVHKQPHIFTVSETANIITAIASPTNSASKLPAWFKRGINRCHYQQQNSSRPRMTSAIDLCRKIFITLKPCKSGDIYPSLVCFLQMKCLQGYHKVEGLKLSFDNPVTEKSVIGNLVIMIDVLPSKYHFAEHLKIEQSKDVELQFSRSLLISRGQTVIFRAVAKEAQNYNFLQFDENNSFAQDSPFTCSLGSIPKGQRLFFISEVLYRDAPRRTGPFNYRYKGYDMKKK